MHWEGGSSDPPLVLHGNLTVNLYRVCCYRRLSPGLFLRNTEEIMAIDWSKLSEELAAEVARLGFEWIEFTHSSSFRAPWLRLFVDRRETALTIEDATFLSRVLVILLQARLPESVDFRLEVSSPGLDRPIRQPWQFVRQIGQSLQVKCNPELGYDTVNGMLKTVDENGIALTLSNDSDCNLEWKNIVEGKVVFVTQEKKMKPKGNRR